MEPMNQPDVSSLCACGCGRPSLIANFTNHTRRNVKWKPVRFINGHGNRKFSIANIRNWGLRSENGCLEWSGCMNAQGRPTIRIDTKIRTVSRVVMETALGRSLLASECVCHRCDNPK